MRSLLRVGAVLLLAGMVAAPLAAQEAAKKDATPKPAPSPSQVILDSWNGIGRKLIAMAEDFPEDKYDFKPNPAQRSFAEQLLHAAGANYFFTNPAKGEKSPTEEEPPRTSFKTKAEIVAYVKKSFEEGAEAIKAKGDEGLAAQVKFPFGNRMVRLSDLAYDMIEHSGEHYGQLVVYYRVLGMVPPASRPKK